MTSSIHTFQNREDPEDAGLHSHKRTHPLLNMLHSYGCPQWLLPMQQSLWLIIYGGDVCVGVEKSRISMFFDKGDDVLQMKLLNPQMLRALSPPPPPPPSRNEHVHVFTVCSCTNVSANKNGASSFWGLIKDSSSLSRIAIPIWR